VIDSIQFTAMVKRNLLRESFRENSMLATNLEY